MSGAHANVEPFHAVEINRLAHARERRGLPVIHMEVGQPSAGAPAAALAAGQHALTHAPQGYWESDALRERIAALYQQRYGLALEPQRVILTMGGSGAFVLAVAVLVAAGARVALARPGYPAHRNVLRAFGVQPLELDCGAATRFQPSAAQLAALEPAPAGLIVTSPSNPTGTMLEAGELAALAAVARARGIRLVSDETYHGITFGPAAHTLLEFEPDAIVLNSFSKYWCMTGWRLGWAVVPAGLAEAFRRYAANLFLVPPTLAQHVALAALEADTELQQRVAEYADNRRELLAALPQLGITRFAPADGAFYLYADIGHLTSDSLVFCRELLDATGLALNTGRDFDTVQGHRFLRISFAVSTGETRRAIDWLGDWLRRRRTG
ncbi:MAG: aminotransferase class I/II-fold pyridoxal phosphate-dependent enzyme [Gammaproteobacteria bacterium]|nr:aminotransferase class I/II-fold pyridoxal phosphate-dependent enzyme [Gammaproteobacteria bacterium]